MAPRRFADLVAVAPTFSADQKTRLAALSDEAIDRLADTDPDSPPMTDDALDRAVFARNVRQAREQMGLTQPAFAERFHIKLTRLRDWERARYKPDTVAMAYIKTILHDPQAVERALSA